MIGAHVLITVLAPLLAPDDPVALAGYPYTGPSAVHWFGTDQLGRDVLSRTLYGGRLALIVGPGAAAVGVGLATVVGSLAGYLGGWFDEIVTRAVDGIMPIPSSLMMLIIVAGFGSHTLVLLLGIAFVYGVPCVRVVRAAAQDLITQDFVLAARARGEKRRGILLREVGPNLLDVVLVELPIRMTFAVLLISALSFLGVGARPPTADWGLMIADNPATTTLTPWATILPLCALTSLILALNIAADATAKTLGIDRTRRQP